MLISDICSSNLLPHELINQDSSSYIANRNIHGASHKRFHSSNEVVQANRSNSAAEYLIDPDNSVGMLILQPTKQYDGQDKSNRDDSNEKIASKLKTNKRKSDTARLMSPSDTRKQSLRPNSKEAQGLGQDLVTNPINTWDYNPYNMKNQHIGGQMAGVRVEQISQVGDESIINLQSSEKKYQTAMQRRPNSFHSNRSSNRRHNVANVVNI